MVGANLAGLGKEKAEPDVAKVQLMCMHSIARHCAPRSRLLDSDLKLAVAICGLRHPVFDSFAAVPCAPIHVNILQPSSNFNVCDTLKNDRNGFPVLRFLKNITSDLVHHRILR